MSGDCVLVHAMEGVVKSSKQSGGLKNNSIKSVLSPPPIKKLKQGRLPFKPLEPKPTQLYASLSPNSKKRKLSDPVSGPQKASKSKRSEENCCKPITLSIDDADDEVTSSSELDQPQKKERRSSVENDAKPKKVGLIEKFLMVKTTQQLEVTTSCAEESEVTAKVVDLTDSDNDVEAKLENASGDYPEKSHDKREAPSKDEDQEKADSITKKRSESSADGEGAISDKSDKATDEPESVVHSSICTAGNGKETDDMDQGESAEAHKASPASQKSDSPDTSPTTNNHALKTPSSAKRSRTRLPLSSEKKAKKEHERSKKDEEKERLRLEKQKAKEEKERLKKEEKEKKEQEKAEAKLKKDKERQEKQEQKDREKKAKEEEQKKKEEEKLKQKEIVDAEKKKKEDERKKKEDEKRKKEEEKQRAEEEKVKKQQKVQSAFQSFFTKPCKEVAPTPKVQVSGRFMGFQVKKDMRLAPAVRVQGSLREEKVQRLNSSIQAQDSSVLYVEELRHGKVQLGAAGKTWPITIDKDLEVISQDAPAGRTMRTKFLKFRENHRPPYYGTWRKKSNKLGPRKPFGKDEGLMDYEVDSDDEWEEEEPGESLSNSEGEDEDEEKEENDDEEEDGDGFFVPHGYLSEGEGCEDDDEDMSPEAMKARQIAKARAWDVEMKAKCEVLRAVCLGCCWVLPDMERDPTFDKLAEYTVVPLLGNTMPIPVTRCEGVDKEKEDKEVRSKIFKPVPEDAMPDLIRLVHGNSQGFKKILKEFRVYWQRKTTGDQLEQSANQEPDSPSQSEDKSADLNVSLDTHKENQCAISRRQLEMKIREIAVYEKRQEHLRACWYVRNDILEKHSLTDLPVPTKWQWITVVKKEKKEAASPDPVCQTPTSGRRTPNIKQFTKEVSPTSLFIHQTPPTAKPPAMSPCHPEQKTPTHKKTPGLAAGKKTPNIKQFVAPQSKNMLSPQASMSPLATTSMSPLATALRSPLTTALRSPLSAAVKSSPRTPSSQDTRKGDCGTPRRDDKEKTPATTLFKIPDAAAPPGGEVDNSVCTAPQTKAQPTLLSMFSKATGKEKPPTLNGKPPVKLAGDVNANEKSASTSVVVAGSEVKQGVTRGTGTAEEPMEIDCD